MKTLKMFSVFLVATVFIIGCDMDEDEEKEVTIFRPVDGAVVYRECSISINTNYDVDSVEYSIRQVDPLGGTVTAPSDSVPRFPYQWDTTVHPDSSYHEIFAKAFYPDEEVLSDTVIVMVDNSIPLVHYVGTYKEYDKIQDGIDDSSNVRNGDTLKVMPGIYYENIDFIGRKIILVSAEGPDSTIIDGNGSNVVTFNQQEDSTSIIDGFTIRNSGSMRAGIVCQATQPIIRNNTVTDCDIGVDLSQSAHPLITNNSILTNTGYGIYCVNSNPTIEQNEISDNFLVGVFCSSSNPNIAFNSIINSQKGIICQESSSPTIRNNMISDNAENGIYCSSSDPVIHDNVFVENDSIGVYCRSSDPEIYLNKFEKNTVGIYCYNHSSPEIKQNLFTQNAGGIICYESSSPDIYNNLIINASGIEIPDIGEAAGGIGCVSSSSPMIVNNTIADGDGVGIGSVLSSPIVLNTIIWGNELGGIVSESTLDNVSYSDVQDGYPGTGNKDADPLFVDPENGDYHLQDGSPCKGTGQDGVDMGAYGGPGGDWEISP